MKDEEFEKFSTDLGFALKVIKHQSENADQVIMAEGHQMIDRETAEFLNSAMNMKLEYVQEPGGVDMCKAMEKRDQMKEVTGAIKGMRSVGVSDDIIINEVMEMFNVTREYVLAIMKEQVA